MKKILSLSILFMGMLCACGPSKEEIEAREKAKQDSLVGVKEQLLKENELEKYANVKIVEETDNSVEIHVFHGCSYIVIHDRGGSAWGGHMGDCPNPIHNK